MTAALRGDLWNWPPLAGAKFVVSSTLTGSIPSASPFLARIDAIQAAPIRYAELKLSTDERGTATGWFSPQTASAVPPARPSIQIANERFSVEVEDGITFVAHPQWSLVGSGDTLRLAIQALLDDAKELGQILAAEPEDELSESAKALRDFALSVG